MHARLSRHPVMLAFAAGLALALAAWNNVVVPRVPGCDGCYVAVNAAAAAAVLAGARGVGLTWRELGLAGDRLGAGLRWGAACVGLVAAGYVLALALPVSRPLLADDRVAGRGAGEIAYDVLVRIPVGTVLWEEIAFRAVLLAALARLVPLRWAVALSAAVFGVWHVRPTLSALAINDLAGGPFLTAAAVLLGCAFTAAAGVLFAWLRLRSGSLLAPAMLHVATNSLGTLAAAAAVRW